MKKITSIMLVLSMVFALIQMPTYALESGDVLVEIIPGHYASTGTDSSGKAYTLSGKCRVQPKSPINGSVAYMPVLNLANMNITRNEVRYSISTGEKLSSSDNQFAEFLFSKDQYMICEIEPQKSFLMPTDCGLDIRKLLSMDTVRILNDRDNEVILQTGNCGVPLTSKNGGIVDYKIYNSSNQLINEGTSTNSDIALPANSTIHILPTENINDDYIEFETFPGGVGIENDKLLEFFETDIPDMYPGNTYQIEAETPNNIIEWFTGLFKKTSWSSYNPDVATVNENGLVTAVSPGIYTIACTSGEEKRTITGKILEPNFIKQYTFGFENRVIRSKDDKNYTDKIDIPLDDLTTKDFSYYYKNSYNAFYRWCLRMSAGSEIINGSGAAQGLCAGYAFAAMLFRMNYKIEPPLNYWAPEKYKPGEYSAINLEKDNKNIGDNKKTLMRHIISLFYLQNSEKFYKFKKENDIVRTKDDIKTFIYGNFNRLKDILEDENTNGAYLSVHHKDQGHALYAYDINPTTGYKVDNDGNAILDDDGNKIIENGYDISVYDCNSPKKERHLYVWPVSASFTYQIFEDKDDIWSNGLSFVSADELLDMLNQDNIYIDSNESDTVTLSLSFNSILTSLSGQTAILKDGVLTSEIEGIELIPQYNIMPDADENASPFYKIILPADQYTITPLDDVGGYMSIFAGEDLVTVNTSAASELTLNITGDEEGNTGIANVGVASEAADNEYTVKYFNTAMDIDMDTVEFRGTGNGVNIESTDTGLNVTSEDSVTIAAVTGARERTQENLDASEGLNLAASSKSAIEITDAAGKTKKINVYARESCKKPDVDIGKGTYTEQQYVTLTTETEDADIYYTTDGSDPTENGILYTEPVLINKSCTLKAVAEKYQFNNSSVLSVDYTMPFVNPPYVSLDGGTYRDGQMCMLDAAGEIYYTLDGSSPSEFGIHYTTPLYISDSATLRAVAVSDDGIMSEEILMDYVIEHNLKHEIINSVQNQNYDILDSDTFSDTTEIRMTVRTYDEAYEDGNVLIAEYDENGKIISVENGKVTFSEETEIISVPYIPKGGDKISSVKIFIWDGIDTMRPMARPYICMN